METFSIKEHFDKIIEKTRTIDKFVDDYVEVLNNKTDSYNFYIRRGRRFIKITQIVVGRDGKNTDQLSVHSFVDKNTGLVFKAAGWNAPAKGARYDLLDEASRKRCFANADPYGSYLYRYRQQPRKGLFARYKHKQAKLQAPLRRF